MVLIGSSTFFAVAFELVLEPLFFGVGEPGGVARVVTQEEEDGDAAEDGGNALDDEEPLPAVHAGFAFELEQERRDGRADHAGEGGGGHKLGDGAGALFRGEPEGEIENHAGEEASLTDAEQKAHEKERVWAFDEAHTGGDNAPRDHDAGDPEARADLVEEQVAGQIEETLAKEEDAGSGAVDGGREHEVATHFECGEADVDAVEVGKDVEQEDVGDQVPADF